jgi:hypothetical protein
MSMTEEQAQAFWLQEKRVVEKFVLSKGLTANSPEFYSLAKFHIKSLTGLTEEHPAVIIKSFKSWLVERNNQDS